MKYNHLDMLPEKAFQPVGKRMTLEGGGGPTSSTSTNMPEYAKPYYQELLKQTGKEAFSTVTKAQVGQINPDTGKAYTDKDVGSVTGIKAYKPYEGDRVAGFNEQQNKLQGEIAGLTTPGGFADASAGATYGQGLGYGAAGTGIANALNFQPGSFTSQQVTAPTLKDYSMQTAQSGYNPNLQQYQMSGPRDVQSGTFNQAAADYYSNPYTQNVTNTALREAQLQGQLQKKKLMQGAIGRGTFGGAGSTLMQAELNRGLGQQLGDIQYKGAADAYTNAQQQFQADQARRMQADLANQAAGLTTEQANLKAKLETQGLGANIGKDVALANLSASQQANVQNLAAQLQTQGLSADQAMKAALANQSANLDTQKLTEQSRQFGAGLSKDVGLAGLQAGLDASKLQGSLAVEQQRADLERLKAQSTSAAERQAYDQKLLDLNYQKAMEAQDWQKKQLEFYSNILRGNAGALGSTQVNYTPAPSAVSQVAGLGLAGLGLAKSV
jgi:hypothetical protein